MPLSARREAVATGLGCQPLATKTDASVDAAPFYFINNYSSNGQGCLALA